MGLNIDSVHVLRITWCVCSWLRKENLSLMIWNVHVFYVVQYLPISMFFSSDAFGLLQRPVWVSRTLFHFTAWRFFSTVVHRCCAMLSDSKKTKFCVVSKLSLKCRHFWPLNVGSKGDSAISSMQNRILYFDLICSW